MKKYAVIANVHVRMLSDITGYYAWCMLTHSVAVSSTRRLKSIRNDERKEKGQK
jgi:hypothetical protein